MFTRLITISAITLLNIPTFASHQSEEMTPPHNPIFASAQFTVSMDPEHRRQQAEFNSFLRQNPYIRQQHLSHALRNSQKDLLHQNLLTQVSELQQKEQNWNQERETLQNRILELESNLELLTKNLVSEVEAQNRELDEMTRSRHILLVQLNMLLEPLENLLEKCSESVPTHDPSVNEVMYY